MPGMFRFAYAKSYGVPVDVCHDFAHLRTIGTSGAVAPVQRRRCHETGPEMRGRRWLTWFSLMRCERPCLGWKSLWCIPGSQRSLLAGKTTVEPEGSGRQQALWPHAGMRLDVAAEDSDLSSSRWGPQSGHSVTRWPQDVWRIRVAGWCRMS